MPTLGPKGNDANSEGVASAMMAMEPSASAIGCEYEIESMEQRSIPHVSFVPFDFILCKELPELILERNRPMMFLLVQYVLCNFGNVRPRIGKCAVSFLPIKYCRGKLLIIYPF